MTEVEATDIAKLVFDGIRYKPTEEDITNLSKNILLLEKSGLNKLNKRLMEGGRKIWDTFVEHNLAAELVLFHGGSIQITYEAEEIKPPPDLRIIKEGITYWIHVKNLSSLERDNRIAKLLNRIKRFTSDIQIGKFFGCLLAPNFSEDDVTGLQDFISEKAMNGIENQEYFFPGEKEIKAKVIFWLPRNLNISNLTMEISGDMEAVNLTGRARDQIKGSVIKASAAFGWEVKGNTINIIVLDADKHDDIDICDALFGSEFDWESINGQQDWSRKEDGLFLCEQIFPKVAGVLAVRRKESETPISQYDKTFYLNENYESYIPKIKKLVDFERLIDSKMRPD